jgi:hypothetical protein
MTQSDLALRSLHGALAAEGGSLAAALVAEQDLPRGSSTGPAQIAAAGPRALCHAGEYELLLETILEGNLLHYGAGRVLHVEDQDLALLLGDRLYALGLARLAALGDVEAVGELADLISLLAQAHVRAQPRLADALWVAGAVAVGWGADPALHRAKALAQAQQPEAADALLEAARERRANTWSDDAVAAEGGNL